MSGASEFTGLMGVLLTFASLAGFLMEWYKKVLRKDRATVTETRLAALALSGALGIVTLRVMDVTVIFPVLRDTPWLALLYWALIYLLQLPACMEVWKPALRARLEGRR